MSRKNFEGDGYWSDAGKQVFHVLKATYNGATGNYVGAALDTVKLFQQAAKMDREYSQPPSEADLTRWAYGFD